MKTKAEIEYLMRKAEAGDAEAQNSLACAYYNADGLEKNIPMAISWFEVSANNGNMYAQSNLAYRYRYGTDGFDKDLVKAFDLYKKSAEQGYASSQETLGIFYDYGYGTPRNYEKAVEWYINAARKGRYTAQNNLGVKYERGEGVEKNYYKAIYWYQQAATSGNAFAQCNLGIMFEEGRGVERNYKTAIYWYKKSADKKHQRAKERLEKIKKIYDENIDRFILTAPIFASNPYRILGVFSNATTREITANKSKALTFAKIGKATTFPHDSIVSSLYVPIYQVELSLFEDWSDNPLQVSELYDKIQEKLEEKNDYDDSRDEMRFLYNNYNFKVKQMYCIKRTYKVIERAVASINQPLDKIKYALFWFIKASPIDEEALKYAMEGNLKKAQDLWKSYDTYSSLVNSAVAAFILDNEEDMVQYMTRMIHNDEYRHKFVSAVCGENYQISEEELTHIYIDTLLENMPSIDWHETFKIYGKSADDDEYIDSQLGKKVIDKLEKEISRTKAISRNKGNERYKAAASLMELSRMELYRLEELIGNESLQYQSIADKVANEVLKCAQDYYQKCSTTIYESTQQCVEINQYAYDIAISVTLKERYKKFLSDIKDRLSKLPPKEAFLILNKIDKEIDSFEKLPDLIVHSKKLLLNCAPYIKQLKELLGRNNKSYIDVSTDIVAHAITNVIKEVNEKFDAVYSARKRDNGLYSYWGNKELDELKKAIREGWQVFVDIGVFDMNEDFKKNRYLPNRNTMEKHVVDAYLSRKVIPSINLYSETDFYNACKSLSDYTEYLKKYPNGRHKVSAMMQVTKLKKADNDLWEDCQRTNAYDQYLKTFKDGLHSDEALKEVRKKVREEDNKYWSACLKSKIYSAYLDKYKEGIHRQEAKRLITRRWYIGILSSVVLIALIIIVTIAISN